ncbi:MFS transporter [Ectopseudomonas hydrolytica]|uniref:MFS transporter n=1 Tax=Ectopseudomonas hydrolytica TaxID=2493633 RepID=UPI0018A6E695|nr:MFS transporter [Pseudomonas hydrolytica]MBF8164588.1 MFS transporter [Pseudomonas mendocina]UTH30243.1 MFS transporter [Pseudomonas hydrolytica]UZZ09248.1 MFS transporter [Pseudomonas mendocina]
MRINPPLVALAIGAFGIGVTEFAPMGMLPGIASDLGVSIPAAGLLVSAYALGVLLGAPLMTLTTGRIPRRYLLIGLMGIFTWGNLMSALATDYYSLLIARVVTSLNHGAFFGVGSIVAASVVAPDKRAGAVAAMFMGLTLATIGGVPLATWFGEVFGWRTAFAGITGLGVLAMLALWFALPNVPLPKSDGVLAEIRVLGRGPVLAALAILIWGIASFAIVPPLQMRVMEAAKAAPNLASAVNIGAFNLGNAIGAALGGVVIKAGLGYPAISLAGAAMAGLGLLMVLGFAWRSRGAAAVAV